MYRNYDWAGAQFGDSYRQSVSTDESKLAVYSALWLMAPDGHGDKNKDFSAIVAPLNLIATPNTPSISPKSINTPQCPDANRAITRPNR